MLALRTLPAILFLWAKVSVGLEVESGPYTAVLDGLDAFDCSGDIVWEQIPDGVSGLASHVDSCYPFSAEVADDFVGTEDALVGVGWWGLYWGGSPITPTGFVIRVYLGDTGLPGELVFLSPTSDFHETPGSPSGYCSQLDEPFPQTPGQTYLVSVQADFCFPPQFGVATGEGNGRECAFRSAFFGFPDFVHATEVFGAPYEFAFVLYDDDASTPSTETTWTAIKRAYRRGTQ